MLGALAATLVLALATASPVGAADGFVRGSGAADAAMFGLALKQGAGSVGITWAASSTSYRDDYAAASAKPLDMQLVRLLLGEGSRCAGDTSPVPLPDSVLPPELATNSLATTAGTTVEGDANFPGLYNTPSPGPVGHGSALANASPSSTAAVKANNINLVVAEIVNPSTSAQTSLVGNVRTATATATAEKLSFLWGAMEIENPTWTATVKTGGETVHEGTFTVSGGTLWGQKRTATEAMADLAATADFIKNLLGYLGLSMDLPKTVINGDLVSVSPLMIHLTDSPLGKEIIAPFLSAPTKDGSPTPNESIEEALTKWASESCDNKRYRQIAEIILGLLKGSGSLELPIGGATATTDATPPPAYDPILDELEPLPAVEGESIIPAEPDTYSDNDTYADDSSDYSAEIADDTTAPPDTTAETDDAGVSNEVNFAAPVASQTKTIAGVTGGPGVLIGSVMILLAAAGVVLERVFKARRPGKPLG